jgi:phosphopantothenoylcysteine decarboxylase/phosphopantothenate--cysteine ligase
MTMGTTVALGVSSSISVYKACEVLRGFQKNGLEVRVLMTLNASRMIAPLLFSALARSKAIVDPIQEESGGSIAHIELAREISLFCVAPATANVIAKFAKGVADDFLSTFYLAVDSPVLIAPAMNEAMFLHPRTQANIRALKAAGVEFVEPEKGYLACREEGWGRLAAPERIVEEGLRLVRRSRSLAGKRVLVTAGPTREYLDPVRFLSNRSSGKMGYALAAEALSRGAEVTLVSGPTALLPPFRAKLVPVETGGEMGAEVAARAPEADVIIMAAAVSDFRFPKTAGRKLKKNEFDGRIALVPTPDILEGLGRSRRKEAVLVGFAAETDRLEENALRKLREKNLDLVVANDVKAEGIGFDADENQVVIIDRNGRAVRTERLSKREIGRLILDEVEGVFGRKNR